MIVKLYITDIGVNLRKKINWPIGPVKNFNNWPLQNSTGPRNIGPLCGPKWTDIKGGICPPFPGN
jgi:hypothetical protein